MNYLLSIVIPTRNRAEYANLTVRQVLQCSRRKAQVIVQDNSDKAILKDMLSDILGCTDLTYHYTSECLSFVDNFNQALQLAEGEYVIVIGDDDGITSRLLHAAAWAKKHHAAAVKPGLHMVYFWPGSKVFKESEDNGRLKITIPKTAGNPCRWKNPQDGMKRLLKNGCQGYLDLDLVKVYHGLVRRDLLKKIEKTAGTYVGGLSPDIYLAAALSLLCQEKLAVTDVPLTISGICGASGSSASSTGAHTGALKDAPHFRGHASYEWSRNVPAFYSVETIWADSALAAVRDIAPDMERYYKSEKLTYELLKGCQDYRGLIWSSYIKNGGSRLKFMLWHIGEFMNRVRKSAAYRMQGHQIKEWTGVGGGIAQASRICESYLYSRTL